MGCLVTVLVEQTYAASNGVTITYLEDPHPVQNYLGRQKLLVIFQSLGDEKSDEARKRYPYTLVDGLKYFNCRKIYVKDDQGLAGDYYLGSHGSFTTQAAVQEFLRAKIQHHGIARSDLTTFGFSKGGYAALLFGYHFGAGTVIAAVPQVDLTHWIYTYKPFLTYILPANPTEDDKARYSTYLEDQMRQSVLRPERVYVISSHHDNTFQDHIPRLLEALEETGVEARVHLNDEYCVTRHNNVVPNSMNVIMAILSSTLVEPSVRSMLQ